MAATTSTAQPTKTGTAGGATLATAKTETQTVKRARAQGFVLTRFYKKDLFCRNVEISTNLQGLP